HAVPLDELVGAPRVEDPRVHAQPVEQDGMTLWPLTQRSDGLQAYRAVIPHRGPDRPEQRSHEGYEWLYVLSGRLRLLLGDHDLVLAAGEVAEFDTRAPHWFGAADPVEPAE